MDVSLLLAIGLADFPLPPLYFSADRPLSAWGSLETKGGGGGGGVGRGLLQTFRSRLRKGEERATEKVLSCGRKLLFLPFLSQFYPPTFLRPPPNPLSPPFAAAVVSGMHNQGWPKRRRRRRRGQFHSLPKSCIHGSTPPSSDPPSPSSRLPSPPCGFLTLPSLPWVKRPEKGKERRRRKKRNGFFFFRFGWKEEERCVPFFGFVSPSGSPQPTNERTNVVFCLCRRRGERNGRLVSLAGGVSSLCIRLARVPTAGSLTRGTQKGLYCSRVEATETTEGILPSSLEVSF